MNQTEPSTTTNAGACRPRYGDIAPSPAGVDCHQLGHSVDNGVTNFPSPHSPASNDGSISPNRAFSERTTVTSAAEFYGMQSKLALGIIRVVTDTFPSLISSDIAQLRRQSPNPEPSSICRSGLARIFRRAKGISKCRPSDRRFR